MKFSFTVHCDTIAELKDAIRRIDGAAGSIEMPRKTSELVETAVQDSDETSPTLAETPQNINPGPSGISKIGTSTKEWIIGELRQSSQPGDHFGTKYEDHLKLLWARHEIKFDGALYYI